MSKQFMLFASSLFTLLGFELLCLVKINQIVGMSSIGLSAYALLGPLAGVSAGALIGLNGMLLRRLLRIFFAGGFGLLPLSLHIPTSCGALYWTYDHWLIRAALPAVCMAIFIMHPVGALAIPYALYWLIPIGLFYAKQKSVFATAIGATLTQHAVGSVLWLYCMPMTAADWMSLIPVVFVERLLAACAMTICYHAGLALWRLAKDYWHGDSVGVAGNQQLSQL